MRNLLTISRELAAIAQAGLTYTRDDFDRERFLRLLAIADELFAGAAPAPPFSRPRELGYPTPKTDVRAAVFRDDSVLLVRETATGAWTLPGGWADVNLSPAENAEKECLEESGYAVKARAVTSIVDRDRAGYPPHANAIYKIFMLCDLVGGAPKTSSETSAVAFFPVDRLPELDRERVCAEEILRAYSFLKNPVQPAAFN